MLATMATWREFTAPAFATKAAGVVGPYEAPPEITVVSCVDEKLTIQAPRRT
jgi:hypothetical protein